MDAARRFDRLPTRMLFGLRVPVASWPPARLLGLAHLDRERAGVGLLLPHCNSVHTFGMRFALDLVFLDATDLPLRLELGFGPRRICACRAAASVLELPAGSVPALGGAVARVGVVGRVNRPAVHEHRGEADVAPDRRPRNDRRM